MSRETALLTFSIGPVHAFISQARRIADLWTGSDLLSHLIGKAINVVRREPGCSALFPAVDPEEEVPAGLPNRLVARVPRQRAAAVAGLMEEAVRDEWNELVGDAVKVLARYGIVPHPRIWSRDRSGGSQTDAVFQLAWSWVPEDGYPAAALAGARRYDGSRAFRPFVQVEEHGEKCAICGERTALPDGHRDRVREAWKRAQELAEETSDGRFFRLDQTRLCLVCATKRLYSGRPGKEAYFEALDKHQPEDGTPYLALVSMDGDRMGEVLSLPQERLRGADLERFHRELSRALAGFAAGLRGEPERWRLNLNALGGYRSHGSTPPQLLYAGGEDVIFVCDPRDAFPLAWRVRERYRQRMEELVRAHAPESGLRFTLSAGILYAHTRQPAGQLLGDVGRLLDETAKARAGRDAVALRLAKRGGVPVEVAFHWDEELAPGAGPWRDAFDGLVEELATGRLSSGKTFDLRREETTLTAVLEGVDDWRRWLADQLERSGVVGSRAVAAAGRIAPFFLAGKAAALRLVRFLGSELQSAERRAS